MTKTNNDLFSDVEALLKQSVIAEASSKIWLKFERALAALDPESAELLTRHFNGATPAQLSRDTELSVAEVEAWLKRAKRELVNGLRSDNQVRQ